MNNTTPPPTSSPFGFLRPTSPRPQSLPGFNMFSAPMQQPQRSLGSQLSTTIQSTFPGKVLGALSSITTSAQQSAQAPIAAALSQVVSPAAANVAASNFVSFFTPPVAAAAQSMDKIIKTQGREGIGEASLTATKSAVSKLGSIPALLVKQADIVQAMGETFYGASKAQQAQPKRGMFS